MHLTHRTLPLSQNQRYFCSSRVRMICLAFLFCIAAAISSPAQTLTTLASFDGTNGSAPAAPLIQASDGNLYGTTEYGGPISGCEGGFNPCGTVFKITLSGTLTTLHTFVYSDGAFPCPPSCKALTETSMGQTRVRVTAAALARSSK